MCTEIYGGKGENKWLIKKEMKSKRMAKIIEIHALKYITLAEEWTN